MLKRLNLLPFLVHSAETGAPLWVHLPTRPRTAQGRAATILAVWEGLGQAGPQRMPTHRGKGNGKGSGAPRSAEAPWRSGRRHRATNPTPPRHAGGLVLSSGVMTTARSEDTWDATSTTAGTRITGFVSAARRAGAWNLPSATHRM